MMCEHCGAELTASEIEANERTAQVHGVNFQYCALCWDAWGEMTYGWQAGVPAHKRVSYTDRTKKWDARRKK